MNWMRIYSLYTLMATYTYKTLAFLSLITLLRQDIALESKCPPKAAPERDRKDKNINLDCL